MSKKEEKEIKKNDAVSETEKTEEIAVKKEKKEKPLKEKKQFNKRKFKYGAVATAITVVFIAAVVLLNVFASQLTERYGLKIDTTKEQIFEISDQTVDYLKGLNEDITIDVMLDESTLDSGSVYHKLVKEITDKYEQNCDKIKVNYYDLEKHPEIVTKYAAYTSENIQMTDIVVSCSGRVKVLSMTDLYEVESNYMTGEQKVTAIRAEEKLTSAIMFVADPNPPKVAILSCQQSDAVKTSVSQFPVILESNGYTVETVDPLTQDIDESYSVLVLAAPSSDLTQTVIEKLNTYLENGGNYGKNLLYFASYDQRETPNLDAFLEEWGIKVEKGYVHSNNTAELLRIGIGGLQTDAIALQAKLTSGNESLVNSTDIPIAAPLSRPLDVTFTEGDGRETEVILKTSETAFIIDENTTQENMDSLPQAERNVLVRGSKHRYEGEEKISSSVYACGSAFFIDYYVTSINALNNQEFMVNLINSCSGKNDGMTILSKSLAVEKLNISEQGVHAVALLVNLFIPLAIAVVGFVVYIRRRNR